MVSGDFADLDAGLAGQLDDGVAGDAFEDAGVDGRREQPAAADQEDVVAGALGHLALVVEHQGLDAAGLKPLDLGQDVVQVVERLDPRARAPPDGSACVLTVTISRPFSYNSSG